MLLIHVLTHSEHLFNIVLVEESVMSHTFVLVKCSYVLYQYFINADVMACIFGSLGPRETPNILFESQAEKVGNTGSRVFLTSIYFFKLKHFCLGV